MLKFFKQLVDFNEKQLSGYRKKLDLINALEDKARDLKDEDFPKETLKLKEKVANGESLDSILPWSFALVREAARRTLGMRHFDVQLMAGIALHDGKIIEQKTGEGKTLTASTALYLNALGGKGAHLVTVNDYLARRDAGWMGVIYDFLGLTSSAIISDHSYIFDRDFSEADTSDWRLAKLRTVTRKEAYEADITYGINSEYGFDYLRDNMSQSKNQLVQRGFNFAVVDEADSVLIDEARTPHIISAPYEEDTSKYYDYAKVVKQLDPKTDVIIDEKLRTAHLSDAGLSKVEKILGVENMYEKDYDTLFHIEAAIKAEVLFQNDKEYIVRNGEVVIVDEFTGRLLQGRRFSEGLHQAIEAKERVAIKQESRTLATVSLQNYFRMYDKLAGMTGTAATEAEEFNKIYKADVVVIPTHRNIQRQDDADEIYKTIAAKYNAVADEVAREHKKGRPVLIGTTSIDKNEFLANLLKKRGVPHQLLNAKNHENEAQIIARAGEKGAVTVATNMAGRGVDIILGGMQPSETESDEKTFKKNMEKWQEKHDEVVAIGGLYVIGTERHESRRIDNQLRGRAGRQGDPGESKFYVSLEDDLMRIFGGEQISKLMNFFNLPDDQPLSHSMVSKAIEQAQVKVEGFNFDIRKHLVEYDDVLNKQRDIIYSWRRKLLLLPDDDPAAFTETVTQAFREVFTQITASFYSIKDSLLEADEETIVKDFEVLFPHKLKGLAELLDTTDEETVIDYLLQEAQKEYDSKDKKVGQDYWNQIVRGLFLSTVDQFWTKHLTGIDDLREGINLRGYAQLDPLVEYKNEAFRMFEELIGNINHEFTRRVMHIQIDQYVQPAGEIDAKAASTKSGAKELNEEKSEAAVNQSKGKPSEKAKITYVNTEEGKKQEQKMVYKAAAASNPYKAESPKQEAPTVAPPKRPGRNDPCWCGSGKKYKKCHYPN